MTTPKSPLTGMRLLMWLSMAACVVAAFVLIMVLRSEGVLNRDFAAAAVGLGFCCFAVGWTRQTDDNQRAEHLFAAKTPQEKAAEFSDFKNDHGRQNL